MAKTRGGVTLADVARRCNVSPSTVSRVLNNFTEGFSVRPQVRDHIVQTARDLGYQPNVAARNLKIKKTMLVGVVGGRAHQIGSQTVSTIILRMAAASLNEEGYSVVTNALAKGRSPWEMPPWKVDGLIVLSASCEEDLAMVEESGLPYVSVNGLPGKGGASLQFDDEGGTRSALEHLIELGHTRIAYASTPQFSKVPHPSLDIRRETYRMMMRRHGLPVIMATASHPGVRVDKPDEAPMPEETFLRWAIEEQKATAILAYSDTLAVYLCGAAYRLGISIPRDVSLLCFNDEYPCDLMNPPLTAVRLPTWEAGPKAAEMLLELMENEGDQRPRHEVMDEILIARDSTAPPGKR